MKNDRRNFLKLTGAGGIGFAGITILSGCTTNDSSKTYGCNIKDYGAVGDGNTLNSNSIQNAINKCSENGGGQVYVPPGKFMTGTVYLRSNVSLYLENGSVLLGSPNREDYNDDEVAPYWRGSDATWTGVVSSCHLIYARNAKNVGITGDGIINGNNKSFWGEGQGETGLRRWKRSDFRPNAPVAFNECENVKLSNITIADSPFYTCWFDACKNVKITGVSILNDRFVPNGDGLVINRCADVIIDSCIIHTADDGIPLKSGGPKSDTEKYPTENIMISNCVISTPCAAIRLGPEGDGPIRNCLFSNITIVNSGTGIYFSMWDMSNERWGNWKVEHGPAIENISFNNLFIDADYPVRILVDNEQSTFPACLKNVNITDVIAQARICCLIESNKLVPVGNINISNVNLKVGKERIIDRGDNPDLSVAFLLRSVNDITLRNIEIEFEQTGTRRLSQAVKKEDCQSVKTENIGMKLSK